MNNPQSVFSMGIPVWERTHQEGSDLVIETVTPAKPVKAEEVASGHVQDDQFVVPNGASYDLSSRYVHYIPMSDVSESAIKGTGKDNVDLNKVLWVTFVRELKSTKADGSKQTKSMIVRIKADAKGDIDGAATAALVKKAFGMKIAEGHSWSKEEIEKIAGFVQSEAGKYNGKSMPLMSNAQVTVQLFIRKEGSDGEPAQIVGINGHGYKRGVVKGKDVIDGADYDDLEWCYQKHQLETHTQHVAHSK
jgi:hypothetical protein